MTLSSGLGAMGVFALLEKGDFKYPSDDAATERIRDLASIPLNEPISRHYKTWCNSLNFLNYYTVVARESELLGFHPQSQRPKMHDEEIARIDAIVTLAYIAAGVVEDLTASPQQFLAASTRTLPVR